SRAKRLLVPISLAALSTVFFALAVWVLSAKSDNTINQWFAALTFAISGWALSIGMLHSGTSVELWSRLAFVTSAFIPVCFLGFTVVFPGTTSWPSQPAIRALIYVAVLFAALALTTPLLISNALLTPTGFTRRSGLLYPVFTLYFLSVWILGVYVFITK